MLKSKILLQVIAVIIYTYLLFCPVEISENGYTKAEPISITMAIVAAAAAASAAAQISAGRAAEAQGKAEKEMYEYNARLQEQEAKNRMDVAKMEEERVSTQQNKMLGYQKAAFAKSGFSIEEGSSVDVMADTYGEFAVDRALTLRKGLIDKMTLESEANLSRAQGKMAAQRGRNAKRASYLSAAGTIGSGIGTMGIGSSFGSGAKYGMGSSGKVNQGISGSSAYT